MDKVWQQPFELAWQSLKAGSFPVGAVLHDPTGNAAFTGRNRSKEDSAPAGQMAGTAIAHAEVDVLAQLKRGKYTDWTMYSTLQPCLFCLTGLLARTCVAAGILDSPTMEDAYCLAESLV